MNFWCGVVGVAQGLALLDAAVIAMAVGIFEAQAHLWTIFLQVEQLLAVERSSTLPGRKIGTLIQLSPTGLYRSLQTPAGRDHKVI